ncbi:unnamed protein product [Prorocentrum cordatum]|uniref:Ankyrin repeat domain-containing protein n=1 Tax=Prorocentrum cordatum TaxID=2364126 RepID=A0ABN9XDM2_9DINO|nr:unnamed protein product [Polarella glacialis]
MLRYVAMLDEISPAWRDGAVVDEPTVEELLAAETVRPAEGTGMGVRASTMAAVEDGDFDGTPVGQLCAEIAEGNAEAVAAQLARSPQLAFQADKDGMAPLHWAADRGCVEVVEALLALVGTGADAAERVNARDGAGDTPLHYAVNTESVEVVRLLVAAGADIHAENEAALA